MHTRAYSKNSKSTQTDDSRASVGHLIRLGPGVKHHSKAFKRFEKKVHAVLDEPKVVGYYKQTIVSFLRQTNYNHWTVTSADSGNATGANASTLEFFSPRQIKDAEAVLWNGKAATINSWALDTSEGANHNFPADQVVDIQSMAATFRFKNVSQHKCTVEMYICKGGDGSSPASIAVDDWISELNAGYKVIATGIYTGGGTVLEQVSMPVTFPVGFKRMWNMEKIVFEFEPGEEAFHLLRGTRGFWDGSKHTQPTSVIGTPVWQPPGDRGNGCTVFFRMLNNLSLATALTGDLEYNTGQRVYACHPPNVTPTATTAGGVVVEIVREYKIRLPADYPAYASINTLATLAYNNNLHNPATVPIDIEIDADQPSTVPVNPN